jgi:glycosyltransferase involved in cell wall biosynthesis
MRIAFLSTASHFDVRFMKIAATARHAGHELFLIGLDRQPGSSLPPPPPGVVLRSFQRAIPNRRALLRALPAFARHIIRQLRDIKPDIVYCHDEETVLFALLARLTGCGMPPIVCDIYDSLPLRVPGKFWRLVARGVAALALGASRRIIVTDENRRALLAPRHLPRATVLPNYPRRADFAATGTLPTGPTRILVAGLLLPMRGLGQLLRACDVITEIELWCAGQVFAPWVRDVFLKSPVVRYLGVLPQSRVLQLTEECDAVFSFYEPLTPNDVNASPNKLYDAMAVGRPVIINTETMVARFVAQHDLGYVTGYYDIDGLRGVLRSLPNARAGLPEFARRVTAMSRAQYSWEAVESHLLSALSTDTPPTDTAAALVPHT